MSNSTARSVPIETLAATSALASDLARAVLQLPPQPLSIALSGTLGSGKTQWVRYFCRELGVPEEEVTSPTYVLLQQYRGARKVHHLDLYRLQTAAEVWDLGVDELFELPQIVVIEWADRFPECIPSERLAIHFEQDVSDAGSTRTATLTAYGSYPKQLLEAAICEQS